MTEVESVFTVDLQGIKILVVEDNPELLFAYDRILSKKGYTVVTAPDGKTALSKISDENFSLVLLDVILPDTTGFEVLKKLKSDTATHDIYVALISSLATSPEHKVQGLESGAEAYLLKPISNKELGAHIDSLIKQKIANDHLRENEERYRAISEKAEQALKESNAYLRSVIENNTDAYLAADKDFKIRFFNRIAGVLTNQYVGKDLVVGESLLDYLEEPYWEKFKGNYSSAMKGVSVSVEEFFAPESIKPVWVNVHYSPSFNNDGDVQGVLISMVDITERKKNEELLCLALEASSDGIWDLNVITGDVYWSPRAFTMLGYEPDEFAISFEKWREMLHPIDRERIWKEIPEQIQTNQGDFSIEYRIAGKNQNWVWLNSRGKAIQTDSSGNIQRMIGTQLNITERKLAEEALRESEEKYRLLHENAGIGIGYYTPDGTIISFNNVAAKHMNGVSEDLAGKSIHDIFSKSEAQLYHDRICKAVLSDIPVCYEDLVQLPVGNKYFLSTISKITGLNNNIVRVQIISQDISELKKTEKDLIKAKEKAGESDRLKTAFLHNLSHEIRTPMNAIMGFSEMLVRSYNDKTRLEKYSNIIIERSRDLMGIINDILDIAKIDANQLPVNSEPFKLGPLFQEIKNHFIDYQRQVNKQHIVFDTDISQLPSDIVIITDRVKLKQIFGHLINNAFKFTDKGKIVIGCFPDKDEQFVFYVEDTGIGIPVDKHEFIFGRFAQVDHKEAKLYGGAGLGLSIVKGLINLLEGKVWVRSEPGKGSVFYFSLINR